MSTAPRLAPAALSHAKPGTRLPTYDRSALKTGIVHLGLGAFFRAHGAEYTEDVLEGGPLDWGILGVSLQRPDQRDRLAPQSGLYTLIAKSGDAPKVRVLGAVTGVLVAPESPEAVISAMTSPDVKIVTLTITEKGYCHDPATGALNLAHPDITHDLETPESPRSAVGFLVAALARRKAAGTKPFTVLTCDNLPHNGKLVRGLVLDFAKQQSPDLASWIARHGAFPSTMVDRIVPAATEADLAEAQALTGLFDAAPVAHEPFRQWVIEDRFVDGERPAWERAGAEMVEDVAPYEAMKLRLLNASHSALAYLGYLGGHETIGDCVGDAAYRAFVEALWAEEIIPVTPTPPGADLAAYARALLARYDNPAIRHRTWQIAMDGSQKLPQRLLDTVRLRLKAGLPLPRLAAAIAAWMHYVGEVDLKGTPIDVRDPMLPQIRAALASAGAEAAARVDALLGLTAIFGAELGAHAGFRVAVLDAYQRIRANGASASLDAQG